MSSFEPRWLFSWIGSTESTFVQVPYERTTHTSVSMVVRAALSALGDVGVPSCRARLFLVSVGAERPSEAACAAAAEGAAVDSGLIIIDDEKRDAVLPRQAWFVLKDVGKCPLHLMLRGAVGRLRVTIAT